MSLNKNRGFPRLFSYSQLGPNRLGRQRQASETVLEPQAGCLAEVAPLPIPSLPSSSFVGPWEIRSCILQSASIRPNVNFVLD